MNYKFSNSTLNVINECPRCLWLHFKKGIKRPRGIFPSLPGGIDNVLKPYFNGYRVHKKLPAELRKDIPKGNILFKDQDLLNQWRDWRRGLKYDSPTGVTLSGALDDCLINKDQKLSPLDYKTRGYPPKSIVDSERYYGLQLSIYSLLLQKNGYEVTKKGYLVYYYPKEVQDKGHIVFNIKVYELDADPQLAIDTCKKALVYLKSDSPPESSPSCVYCAYTDKLI